MRYLPARRWFGSSRATRLWLPRTPWLLVGVTLGALLSQWFVPRMLHDHYERMVWPKFYMVVGAIVGAVIGLIIDVCRTTTKPDQLNDSQPRANSKDSSFQ